MKKSSVILFALMLVTVMLSYSCNKSCKGGGWYGDRNLGFAPIKEKPVDNAQPIFCEEVAECEISNP